MAREYAERHGVGSGWVEREIEWVRTGRARYTLDHGAVVVAILAGHVVLPPSSGSEGRDG